MEPCSSQKPPCTWGLGWERRKSVIGLGMALRALQPRLRKEVLCIRKGTW